MPKEKESYTYGKINEYKEKVSERHVDIAF